MRILVLDREDKENIGPNSYILYFDVVFVKLNSNTFKLVKNRINGITRKTYTENQMMDVIFAIEKYDEVNSKLEDKLNVGVDVSYKSPQGRYCNGKKVT